MKCRECGKELVVLTNHLRIKHLLTRREYCLKWNLPFGQALADSDLREHLSQKAKLRMLTTEGMDHYLRMRSLAPLDGNPGPRELPQCSNEHCLVNNRKRANDCWEAKSPAIIADWNRGMSNRDIADKYDVAPSTIRKWRRLWKLPPRHLVYVAETCANAY
jgi:ROS/MUCR transcriptional regulator protein/Homeodomain-like domain